MTLDPILLFMLPIILIVIALAYDSIVFSFLGGVSAVLVGIEFMDTLWVSMIFIALGLYFILAPAFAED